ncbi:MAG: flagellar biosynthesis protein FlhA [Limnochordia bacterium]|nr:flagellar biosynthesis protein FlhA [Limnochordia bacterium]
MATKRMKQSAGYKDVVVMVGIIGIVIMMVVPLPPYILDLLLAANISFAVVLLLLSMNVKSPLDFSIFPPVLLVATLFRLALNVSSTRLILLHGYAGRIILAFGNFVVGGNYVVGLVVFLILVIIQFVVITKGSERVAEVAARFTLDAMPGKQMSIDADLNAGLIGEDEARKRRQDVAREADFYGAMDGASKFVKGDAIAGIIITFINIVGGLIIGVVQGGLSVGDAIQKYTLLTVGDGLVSQIPALLIATATGMIVTRNASTGNLGEVFLEQVGAQPKTIGIAAGVLVVFSLIPGLPFFPFLMIGLLLGITAYRLTSAGKQAEEEYRLEKAKDEQQRSEIITPEDVLEMIKVDPLEVEIGYGLVVLTDEKQGGDLLSRFGAVRKQCALELGMVVPMIRIRDNVQLGMHNYTVKIYGAKVGEGELRPNRLLALCSEPMEELAGEHVKDPTFGMPAVWIQEEQRDEAEALGCTVVDPSTVLVTHITQVIKDHAHELLGRTEVKKLLDSLKQDHGPLVDELVPNQLSIGQIQSVLKNLLKEGISIRNLVGILEAMADHASSADSIETLTEYVRQSLSRQITEEYLGPDGILRVIRLDPALEALLAEEAKTGGIIEAQFVHRLMHRLMQEIQKLAVGGYPPVVLTSAPARPVFRRIIEPLVPQLIVLSFNEIDPKIQLEVVGMVNHEN